MAFLILVSPSWSTERRIAMHQEIDPAERTSSDFSNPISVHTEILCSVGCTVAWTESNTSEKYLFRTRVFATNDQRSLIGLLRPTCGVVKLAFFDAVEPVFTGLYVGPEKLRDTTDIVSDLPFPNSPWTGTNDCTSRTRLTRSSSDWIS